MSSTFSGAAISVAPHTPASYELVLPDRHRVLSPGLLRAVAAVLVQALAQPTPVGDLDIAPAVAEASQHTAAYAWREADGLIRLDATGADFPPAVLRDDQAEQLRKALLLWIDVERAELIPGPIRFGKTVFTAEQLMALWEKA